MFILQYINVSNQRVEHLKFIQLFCVEYISIIKKRIAWEKKHRLNITGDSGMLA